MQCRSKNNRISNKQNDEGDLTATLFNLQHHQRQLHHQHHHHHHQQQPQHRHHIAIEDLMQLSLIIVLCEYTSKQIEGRRKNK